MAGTKRLEQLNSEIERYLSEIIRTLKDPRINGIISVQEASLTRDFSHCTVHVGIFNSQDEKTVKYKDYIIDYTKKAKKQNR